MIATAPIFNNNSGRLAELAALHRIPAVYQYPEFVAAGGLMALGPELDGCVPLDRRLLRPDFPGEKPSELAVQQATEI